MTNNLSWTKDVWKDYLYWQTQDRKTLKRINIIIESILRTPFEGIGKPEKLKENLSGLLSRRIDLTNRIVYVVDGSQITLISCRYHY
ncbi:MAG: Txe/YoeB family addiction module toxin [Bacteroidetes bacterium]|nr:Txe/YoeB family addiction module toxin [Bacteroidota bacterium]